MNLPNVGAARQAAIAGARCITAAAIRRDVLELSPSIEVYDAEGRPVLTLPFSEAMVLAGLK